MARNSSGSPLHVMLVETKKLFFGTTRRKSTRLPLPQNATEVPSPDARSPASTPKSDEPPHRGAEPGAGAGALGAQQAVQQIQRRRVGARRQRQPRVGVRAAVEERRPGCSSFRGERGERGLETKWASLWIPFA